jgi:hypothetical protein
MDVGGRIHVEVRHTPTKLSEMPAAPRDRGRAGRRSCRGSPAEFPAPGLPFAPSLREVLHPIVMTSAEGLKTSLN